MSKHTPGPWKRGREVDSDRQLVYIPITADKKNVSTTGVYGRKIGGGTAGKTFIDEFGIERHEKYITEGECRANAALIAAAPDLLAACKWMIQFADHFAREHNDGPTMAAMIGQCRQAIEKAEVA